MRFAICNLFLIATVLAGCASAKKQHSPATKPAAENDSKAILYQRTGGIAGTDDRIVIWPDGYVSFRGKLIGDGTTRLNGEELRRVLGLFAGFSDLKDEYIGGGADAYEITIIYGEKTVKASDLAPSLPENFRAIITAIESLASQPNPSP